jgi:hypothetical protein
MLFHIACLVYGLICLEVILYFIEATTTCRMLVLICPFLAPLAFPFLLTVWGLKAITSNFLEAMICIDLVMNLVILNWLLVVPLQLRIEHFTLAPTELCLIIDVGVAFTHCILNLFYNFSAGA